MIDTLQLTAEHRSRRPSTGSTGEDVIIVPAVSDEDAKALFPAGWNPIKPYLPRHPADPTADILPN